MPPFSRDQNPKYPLSNSTFIFYFFLKQNHQYYIISTGTKHRQCKSFCKKKKTAQKIMKLIQCNSDMRELSGPEKNYLISGFLLYPGLVYFIYINKGYNFGPEKITLIFGFLLYPGILYSGYTVPYIGRDQGVLDIDVGNRYGNPRANPARGCLRFTLS